MGPVCWDLYFQMVLDLSSFELRVDPWATLEVHQILWIWRYWYFGSVEEHRSFHNLFAIKGKGHQWGELTFNQAQSTIFYGMAGQNCLQCQLSPLWRKNISVQRKKHLSYKIFWNSYFRNLIKPGMLKTAIIGLGRGSKVVSRNQKVRGLLEKRIEVICPLENVRTISTSISRKNMALEVRKELKEKVREHVWEHHSYISRWSR